MHIKLYLNTADKKRCNKRNYIAEIISFDNVIFKEGQNLRTPTIVLKLDDITLINKFNYCYIEELESYYYVGEPTTMSANMFSFPLEKDILFSNLEGILNLKCIIERQEFKFNKYLDDSEYKVYAYERIITKEFPNGFNNGDGASYVLAMCGGAESNG